MVITSVLKTDFFNILLLIGTILLYLKTFNYCVKKYYFDKSNLPKTIFLLLFFSPLILITAITFFSFLTLLYFLEMVTSSLSKTTKMSSELRYKRKFICFVVKNKINNYFLAFKLCEILNSYDGYTNYLADNQFKILVVYFNYLLVQKTNFDKIEMKLKHFVFCYNIANYSIEQWVSNEMKRCESK